MNISIKCNVSLSKKLRALINKQKFSISANNLINGIGTGVLNISVDDNADLSDLFNKETSIMFIPIEIIDQTMKTTQEDESANNVDNRSVSNLFMNNANVEEDDSTIIKKIGAVKPPNNKMERAGAIKSQNQVIQETPEPFKITQKPEVKKYITSINQLLEAIKLAENKTSDVDINAIKNPRLKAVAMEEKEKAEAIDYPAFVVNHSCASLTINDLGISLMLNIPYNLNNISAKRLANSKDLIAMFRSNMIKLISPDEIQEYMNKVATEQESFGLDVYSNHKEAEAAIENEFEKVSFSTSSKISRKSVPMAEEQELSMNDLEGDTEEEKILKTISSGRPLIQSNLDENNENEVIVTSHRINNGSRLNERRDITAKSIENNKGIKTIRRSGIEFN